jgi:hypothetical protein
MYVPEFPEGSLVLVYKPGFFKGSINFQPARVVTKISDRRFVVRYCSSLNKTGAENHSNMCSLSVRGQSDNKEACSEAL